MFRFSSPVTLRLEAGDLLNWRRGLKATLRVRSGLIHLTQEGDAEDYFLKAGQTMDLRSSGWLVISAEEPVLLSLERAAGWSWSLGAWRELLPKTYGLLAALRSPRTGLP